MIPTEFAQRVCELGECGCEGCVALAPYLPDGRLRRRWTADLPDVVKLWLWLTFLPLLAVIFIFDFDL